MRQFLRASGVDVAPPGPSILMVDNSSLGERLEGCSIGLDAPRLRALRRATSLSTKRRLPLVAPPAAD
jgi:hypothetical protein